MCIYIYSTCNIFHTYYTVKYLLHIYVYMFFFLCVIDQSSLNLIVGELRSIRKVQELTKDAGEGGNEKLCSV